MTVSQNICLWDKSPTATSTPYKILSMSSTFISLRHVNMPQFLSIQLKKYPSADVCAPVEFFGLTICFLKKKRWLISFIETRISLGLLIPKRGKKSEKKLNHIACPFDGKEERFAFNSILIFLI